MTQADRIAGLAVVAAGLAVGVFAQLIETSPAQSHTLSARFFPTILAIVLVALGALLAARPGPGTLADALGKLAIRRGLVMAALVLVYFLSFRHIDFRLGAAVFMVCAMWSLGSRRPLELALVPVVVALGVHAVFRYGFDVLLPAWI